jgi:hypothetical protein
MKYWPQSTISSRPLTNGYFSTDASRIACQDFAQDFSQPFENEAEVVAGGGEDGIGVIAIAADVGPGTPPFISRILSGFELAPVMDRVANSLGVSMSWHVWDPRRCSRAGQGSIMLRVWL